MLHQWSGRVTSHALERASWLERKVIASCSKKHWKNFGRTVLATSFAFLCGGMVSGAEEPEDLTHGLLRRSYWSAKKFMALPPERTTRFVSALAR